MEDKTIEKPEDKALQVWKPLLQKMTDWSVKQATQLQQNKPAENLVPPLPASDELIEQLLPKIAIVEQSIKTLGSLETRTKAERLVFTREVDDNVKNNLMKFEKEYAAQQAKLKADLLPLKLMEARWRKKLQDRLDFVAEFRRKISEDCNNQIEAASIKIHEKVSEIYKNALNDEFGQTAAQEYLEACMNTFSEEDFVCAVPDKGEDKELNNLIDVIYSNFIPSDLLKKFQLELESAFDTFEEDKLEKEEALRLRNAVEKAAVKEEVKLADTNNHFSRSYNAPAPVLAKTADLKTRKALDMPRNKDTMYKIMAEAAGKIDILESYYGGQDLYDIVAPLQKVLEAMADAGREFKTLIFKDAPKGY